MYIFSACAASPPPFFRKRQLLCFLSHLSDDEKGYSIPPATGLPALWDIKRKQAVEWCDWKSGSCLISLVQTRAHAHTVIAGVVVQRKGKKKHASLKGMWRASGQMRVYSCFECVADADDKQVKRFWHPMWEHEYFPHRKPSCCYQFTFMNSSRAAGLWSLTWWFFTGLPRCSPACPVSPPRLSPPALLHRPTGLHYHHHHLRRYATFYSDTRRSRDLADKKRNNNNFKKARRESFQRAGVRSCTSAGKGTWHPRQAAEKCRSYENVQTTMSRSASVQDTVTIINNKWV